MIKYGDYCKLTACLDILRYALIESSSFYASFRTSPSCPNTNLTIRDEVRFCEDWTLICKHLPTNLWFQQFIIIGEQIFEKELKTSKIANHDWQYKSQICFGRI